MAALGNGGEAFASDQDLFYATAIEHARRNYYVARAVYESKTTAAAPGSPTEDDCYIVPSSGTGAFLGHDHEAAFFDGAGWLFWDVPIGYVFSVLDEGTNHKVFTKTDATPTYAELHSV